MDLYGFEIPAGRTDLEQLITDIHKEIFPGGQEQIDEEIKPVWERLKDRYSISDVEKMYVHAILLLYCYWMLRKGQINMVDEMWFFSSVRGTFNLPRIDMLILYSFLKEKIQTIPVEGRSNTYFVKVHQLVAGK
jgi:hypothetical protein